MPLCDIGVTVALDALDFTEIMLGSEVFVTNLMKNLLMKMSF